MFGGCLTQSRRFAWRLTTLFGLVLSLTLPGCADQGGPTTIAESKHLIAWLADNNRSIEVSADPSLAEPEFIQLRSGASAGANRSASDFTRKISESPFGGPVEKLVSILFGTPVAAVMGAVTAEPEVVSRTPAKDVEMLQPLSLEAAGNLELGEAIRDRVVAIGAERRTHGFRISRADALSGATASVKSPEATLEIRVTSIEWRTRIDDSDITKMRLRVAAWCRLSRNFDGVSADQSYTYDSERMPVSDWVADAPSTLKAEFKKAAQSIASQIVASLEIPTEVLTD